MIILGITGGSGSGKTTALAAVRTLGGLTLDCDEIYHRLLVSSPGLLAAIDARFPGMVRNGQLDRKRLGSLVFGDKAALLDLNRIAHGAVKAEVVARLAGCTKSLAAIDAIALFEGGLAELCTATVAVTAPRPVRIARLMAREGISQAYAEARINVQPEDSEFRRRCTYTLENNGGQGEFYQKALALFQSLIPEAHIDIHKEDNHE